MSVVKMSRGYKTFGIRQLLLCLGSFLSPGQRESASLLRALLFKER